MTGMGAKRRTHWREDSRDIAHYEAHAREYAEATRGLKLGPLYDRFLKHVRPGGLILDVGSGSGRDTLAFLRLGYRVEALEPSPRLARISFEMTGIQPRSERAQDLTDEVRFDGIWACASLVHVPIDEMPDTLRRLSRAARPKTPMYLSFKHGSGARIAGDGRPYTDMNKLELANVLHGVPGVRVVDVWLAQGEVVFGERDLWLNIILMRN